MHITSKYETPCNDCGELISPGDQADWIRGQKGVWCLSCHPNSTQLPSRGGRTHGGAPPARVSIPPNGDGPQPKQWAAPESTKSVAPALLAAMQALTVAVTRLTQALDRRAAIEEGRSETFS